MNFIKQKIHSSLFLLFACIAMLMPFSVSAADAPQDASVLHQEIANAVNVNPISAKSKYENHQVTITDTLQSFGQNLIMGGYDLHLKSGFLCEFKPYRKSDIAKLSNGQQVVISGSLHVNYDPITKITTISLDDCCIGTPSKSDALAASLKSTRLSIFG